MNSYRKIMKFAVSAALSAGVLLSSASALYPATVKADSLNLRQAPEGAVITTIPQGTPIAVINNSSSWFLVAVGGKSGYVSGEFLGGATNGDYNLGAATVKCDTYVNLRQQTNTSSAVLATMNNGSSVSVVGIYNGWYKVSYNGQTGFAHPDYIVFSGAAPVATATAPVAAGSSDTRTAVLNYAAQFLGTPYVYGGSSPSGFDCSGFTSYVFANTVTSIPRVAQAQYDGLTHVSRDEMLPGDLVFFGSDTGSISHVGIYAGNDQFIHSPHTGEVVKYDSMSGTYASRFVGAARVITQ